MDNIDPPLVRFFKEKGITQDDIARKLGVSQSYVSALLTGRKSFGKKQAQRFSEAYGLSPSWLLTGEGDMIISQKTGNTQVIGTNQGTAINGGDINENAPTSDREFREYVFRKDAQVDELLAQNGKLIDIIRELTQKS